MGTVAGLHRLAYMLLINIETLRCFQRFLTVINLNDKQSLSIIDEREHRNADTAYRTTDQ